MDTEYRKNMTGIILDLYSCLHSDLKISLSEGHDIAPSLPTALPHFLIILVEF